MSRARLVWLPGAVICALLFCACAPPVDDAAASRTIRVAYSGETGFGDLPSFLAHSRLRDQGYLVTETNYSGTELAVEALATGSADFGAGAITSAWLAAARGAPVRTLMQHVANPHRFVVAPGISSCADLDGRRLALHAEGAVGTALVRAFLAEECPEARPAFLHMPDSSNRAAALLAGGIDAAALDMAVLDWLEQQAPGRFRVLSDFAARWPLIKTTGVQVNTDFARAHPDVVLAYVRARLAADRDLLSNEEMLVAEAERVLGPSDRWPRLARAHIAAHAWVPDGGITEDDITRTLAFFASDTSTHASADSVADLTFLRKILAPATR